MQLLKNSKTRLVASVILLAAVIGISSDALAVDNRGPWYVTNTDTFLTNTAYELWTGDVQLGYARFDYGEGVTWQRAKGGHFIFIPGARDHRHLPVQNFDKVAIFNTKSKKYLVKNNSLTAWSAKPSYEWRVQFVEAREDGVHFAIYNASVNSYLVRSENPGSDGWLSLRCAAQTECAVPPCGSVCPLP